MTNNSCLGCHRQFDSARALAPHLKKCFKYKQETAKWKRLHKEEKERKAIAAAEETQVGGPPLDEGMNIAPEPQSPTPQQFRPSGLPSRQMRLPKRFRDLMPPPPPPVPILPDEPLMNIAEENIPSEHHCPTVFVTPTNSYGVYRIYEQGAPTFTPNESFHFDELADGPAFSQTSIQTTPRWWSSFGTAFRSIEKNTFAPFLNSSVYRLMSWFYNNSNTKSLSDLDTLVSTVIQADDFKVSDFDGFRASKEVERLDKYEADPKSDFSAADGWIETSVWLSVPAEKVSHRSESSAPKFEVKGLFYRRPLQVLKAAYREKGAESFHTSPFAEFWKPSDDAPPERLYSDLYTADAYLEEYAKLKLKDNPDCDLERTIIPLMLWSDSTHLTSFGNASLWPVYLYNGNQSKYARVKPNMFAANHLAYVPKLDDSIQDFYREEFGKPASAAVLTHLRRELMHEVWRLILDNEFMQAVEHGIVMEFSDGVYRRAYPRFFTYSADYPEKVLLTCIKYLGNMPCPRCLVQKCDISLLGTKLDRKRRKRLERVDDHNRRKAVESARLKIYTKGVPIHGAAIKNLLDPKSLIPTRNAFSERLGPHGLEFHSLFVVDLLHEFELGVWKATFTHLIRILYAHGGDSIQKLNTRYRQVPTFGRDTIRKFHTNASGMKKLAARDFEDLLQCAIPCFEGLLPEPHNDIVVKMLFELVTWHGLAKLRLHTESTLSALESSTTRLGAVLRKFESVTCEEYETRELPSEEAARGRRNALLTKNKRNNGKGSTSKGRQTAAAGPRKKKFNLSSYKLHALDDYVKAIRQYGTTDNYSTQPGELEHRRVKRFYPRVHKGKFVRGIAKQVRRERILANIRSRNQQSGPPPHKRRKPNKSVPSVEGGQAPAVGNPSIPFDENERMVPASPQGHYQMSHEIRNKLDISRWIGDNEDDPALMDFLPRLKDHLLGRILGHAFDGDEIPFSDAERSSVQLVNNRIYRHKVIRVNYTSYDMRRCQDSLNPRTHSNIMVLSRENETGHPYWYARIIGIFHARVIHYETSSDPFDMDFLWVRWYGRDLLHKSGWKAKHLPRVGFVDSEDPLAFGFLDPSLIIRGSHIVPSFNHGNTDLLLPPSIARTPSENDRDWIALYINIFVDRDMIMRYRGGGVGHKSTRDATNIFLKDRDHMDLDSPMIERDQAELAGFEEGVPNDDENGGRGEMESDDEEMENEQTDLNLDDGSECDSNQNEGLEDVNEEEGNNVEVEDEEDDYGYRKELDDDEVSDEEENDLDEDGLGAEDGDEEEDVLEALGFGEL